jgi:hypothetical protein
MRVFKSVPVTKNHQNFYCTYLDARVLEVVHVFTLFISLTYSTHWLASNGVSFQNMPI